MIINATIIYKVIRFAKDEILELRKHTRFLESMSDMMEVLSVETLDPVCFVRFDPEDVIMIKSYSLHLYSSTLLHI